MNYLVKFGVDVDSVKSIRTNAQEELKKHGIDVEINDSGLSECFNLNIENPYKFTDLTYLKPHGGRAQIEALCKQAIEVSSKMVCVHSIHIPLARKILSGSNVGIVTVESFPFGTSEEIGLIGSILRDFEIGVNEVDIVFPHHFMASEDYIGALAYLKMIRLGVDGVIKVILETSDYESKKIAMMCLLVRASGLDFVKTSTGFSKGGAKVFDVALMRYCVGKDIGVKASGGIKTHEDAIKMIYAGANRIGASTLNEFSGVDSIY